MTREGIEKWKRYHALIRDNGDNPAMSMQACAALARCSRYRTTLYKVLGWVRVTGHRTWEFTGPLEIDETHIEEMRTTLRRLKAGENLKTRNPDAVGPINVEGAARKVIFSSYGMARRFCVFLVERGYIPPVLEKDRKYYAFRFGGGEPLRYTNSRDVFRAYSANWLTPEEMDYIVDAYQAVPLKHAQL